MNNIKKELIAQIDDCAALGDAQALLELAGTLRRVAYAAQRQALAVKHRLAGRIQDAMRCEQESEEMLR